MGNDHFMHSHRKHHHGMFNHHRPFPHRHHFNQKGGFSLSSITNLISKIPAPILGGLATGAVGVGAHLLMKRFGKKEKELVGSMDPALQQVYNMGKSQLMNHVGANYSQYIPPNVRDAYESWKTNDHFNTQLSHHNALQDNTLRDIANPKTPSYYMNQNPDAYETIYEPENRIQKSHDKIVNRVNSTPERLKHAFGVDRYSD